MAYHYKIMNAIRADTGLVKQERLIRTLFARSALHLFVMQTTDLGPIFIFMTNKRKGNQTSDFTIPEQFKKEPILGFLI